MFGCCVFGDSCKAISSFPGVTLLKRENLIKREKAIGWGRGAA